MILINKHEHQLICYHAPAYGGNGKSNVSCSKPACNAASTFRKVTKSASGSLCMALYKLTTITANVNKVLLVVSEADLHNPRLF